MSLWELVTGWIDQDRTKLLFFSMEPGQILDEQIAAHTAVSGQDYFRLRVAEMFLTKRVQAAKSWDPAVHSLVRCNFANQTIELPNIADSTRLGSLQSRGGGDVIANNLVLTPTMPFNGGTIDVIAALVAIERQNYLGNALKLLTGFAGLLNVAQVSTVLNLAQPLVAGVQDLFGDGRGALHIGLQQSFAASELRTSYIVVLRAREGEVDRHQLVVANRQLCLRGSSTAEATRPFEGFDYMLLKIEVFSDRDDWMQLTAIREPWEEAIKALGDGNRDRADTHLVRAKTNALLAPELTEADKTRVLQKLDSQYVLRRDALAVPGLVPDELPSLQEMLTRSVPSAADALSQGLPSMRKALAVPE